MKGIHKKHPSLHRWVRFGLSARHCVCRPQEGVSFDMGHFKNDSQIEVTPEVKVKHQIFILILMTFAQKVIFMPPSPSLPPPPKVGISLNY